MRQHCLVKALKPVPEVSRSAILAPVEIGKLVRAISEYTGSVSMRFALTIMPCVFLRNSELRCARWTEIDLDNALWTVPAERMKKKREHLVPLAAQVVALFRLLRELSQGELVFRHRIKDAKYQRCRSLKRPASHGL